MVCPLSWPLCGPCVSVVQFRHSGAFHQRGTEHTEQPSRNPKDLTADFADCTDKKREEIRAIPEIRGKKPSQLRARSDMSHRCDGHVNGISVDGQTDIVDFFLWVLVFQTQESCERFSEGGRRFVYRFAVGVLC